MSTSVNGSSSADASAAAWAEGTLAAAEAYAQEQANEAARQRDLAEAQAQAGGAPPNDGVDFGGRTSSEQRALDSFWANDPNRPASSLPGGAPTYTGGGGPPESVKLTPEEAKAFQDAGMKVTSDGNGGYYLETGTESVSLTSQAPLQAPDSLLIAPGYPSTPSGPTAPPPAPPAPPPEAAPTTEAAPATEEKPSSKSIDQQIADALKKGDLDTAAKLAAKGTAAEGRVTVDKSLVDRQPPVLGHTDHNGRVRLSPEAFDNPALLKSVVAHEAAHVRQIATGNFHASSDRGRPDHIVNELEALYAGIAEAKNHPDDLLTQAQRAVWEERIPGLVEQLHGTPYHANVTKTPPDFTLAQGDRCPGSVCYLD
jgi:hypothetical protein